MVYLKLMVKMWRNLFVALRASWVSLRKSDIERAHRVPTRAPNRQKPIVAELASRKKRDEIVAIKRHLLSSDLFAGSGDGKIFVYAQISPELKQLRWQAKEKANQCHWKFVWIKDGILFARKSDSDKNSVKILSVDDLVKIC